MGTRKRRILFCNEASYLPTGFANYSRELMNRVHASGEFDIAELANYGTATDPRVSQIPWMYYPNMPNENNQDEVNEYHSNPRNQWGQWKFEAACAQFKPDVVQSITDFWMFSYIYSSPYRRLFNLAVAPPVDGYPVICDWLADLINADAIFSYTDWGLDVLRYHLGDNPKLKCETPMGINPDVFTPNPDKDGHKGKIGFLPNVKIIGTVMRNQRRKLYPNIFAAFSKFLDTAPEHLAKDTYLYVHTTYPDQGWDIPALLREHRIGHKVLFTYVCKNLQCNAIYPSFFHDARTICKQCNHYTLSFPNSQLGADYHNMPNIYNLFDVYVQYANAEGFGIPMVEAAACGVPVIALDYASQTDVARKLGGMMVKPVDFWREPETHRYFAVPDDNELVSKLINFLSKPKPVRAITERKAREGALKYYNWDVVSQRWMDYFRTVPFSDWGVKPYIHSPATQMPDGLNNSQFVKWAITNIAGRPELINSYLATKMTRDLNWGYTQTYDNVGDMGTSNKVQRTYSRQEVIDLMMKICEYNNNCERARCPN